MKPRLGRLARWLDRHRIGVSIATILVLALGFRFWQITELPPGLHPDMAANGLDIFRILDGDIRPLYNTNGPRESLFFFLQLPFVVLFGNTAWALYIAPAIIGALAVLATYLMVKEWFSRRAGLVASFLMASAPWAVIMSRIGFRASLMPLLIPLTVWLFTKLVKTGNYWWAAVAGLSLGAGFYSYLSYRMVPFIVLAVLVFAWLFYRKALLKLWRQLVVSGLVAAVTLVPMGLYTLSHPNDVIGGRNSVSFTNPELNQGRPLQTLGETVYKTALMFNFKGDENFRHNLGGAPMLNALEGVMFLLGLGLAIRRIKDIRYFSLLTIFGAMLVPEVVTAEGIPHALRAIGVIPVVYIFAAIGILEMLWRWRAIFPRNPVPRTIGLAVLVSLLLVSTYHNYLRYFAAWANAPQTYEAYSEDAVAAAEHLNQHEFSGQRVLIIDGFSNITALYLTHGKTAYTQQEAMGIDTASLSHPMQLVVVDSQQAALIGKLGDKFELKQTVNSPKRPATVLYRVYETKQP